MISTFEKMPETNMKMPDEYKDKILHVALPIKGKSVLMGSDNMPGSPRPIRSRSVSISIQTDSEEETDELFSRLSKGGKIEMPLQKTFWNAYFGTCTDKFGIHWLLNYDYGMGQYNLKKDDSI